MVFLKKRLKAAYISAVATKPKHRKKGFASAVLNAAANHCKNSGFDLCFLMPDINGFYEKFGYFTVLNKNEKILSYKYFKKSKNFIDDLSFNDFFEIYSSVSKNKMLHIKRSKKNSDMIFDDLKSNTGAKTKIYKNKGYIFFDEEENFIRVYELCAKNKVAKNKLLSFAASYKKDILFENRPVMIKILSEKPILKKLKKSAEQMPLSKKDVFINLVL